METDEMIVRFADLMQLKYNELSNIIDIPTLQELLPDTPQEVVRDFYSDHGRNEYFQQQYCDIKINYLKWKRRSLKAKDILQYECFSGFSDWADRVKLRASSFPKDGWECIDIRSEVVNHWKESHTWIVPPIFIEKRLLGDENGYWLVEGHTRISTLKGLVEQSVISPDSIHEIFFADYRTHESVE